MFAMHFWARNYLQTCLHQQTNKLSDILLKFGRSETQRTKIMCSVSMTPPDVKYCLCVGVLSFILYSSENTLDSGWTLLAARLTENAAQFMVQQRNQTLRQIEHSYVAVRKSPDRDARTGVFLCIFCTEYVSDCGAHVNHFGFRWNIWNV